MTATTTSGRRGRETERLLDWIRSLVRTERELGAHGAAAAEVAAVRGEIAGLLWHLAEASRREAGSDTSLTSPSPFPYTTAVC